MQLASIEGGCQRLYSSSGLGYFSRDLFSKGYDNLLYFLQPKLISVIKTDSWPTRIPVKLTLEIWCSKALLDFRFTERIISVNSRNKFVLKGAYELSELIIE